MTQSLFSVFSLKCGQLRIKSFRAPLFGILIRTFPLWILPGWLFFCGNAAGSPAIVIEFASGRVLQQEDVDQSWYPASLTKLMTLYLIFEALGSGELAMDQVLPVSAHAAAQPPTKLGLRTGEHLSVHDAIQAVATMSANDAAVLLAEALAGSEAEFAAAMTLRAKRLGLAGSEFFNASGLPDARQKTTARDMALLAMQLIGTFPEVLQFSSRRSVQIRGRQRWSTNGFIANYPGADGLKTGFTCGSGYNLIATAVRGDVRLIGVVLGAGSKSERSARMRKLLDRGFAKSREPGKRPRIGEFAMAHNAALSAPPYRLDSGRCASGVLRSAQNAPAFRNGIVVEEGVLPGWGILLGIQKQKVDALSVLQKARGMLEKIEVAATPALLRRDFSKGSSWKVLLVGLGKAEAGKSCVHLLSKAVNCVIQSPKRMNSPGYALR